MHFQCHEPDSDETYLKPKTKLTYCSIVTTIDLSLTFFSCLPDKILAVLLSCKMRQFSRVINT